MKRANPKFRSCTTLKLNNMGGSVAIMVRIYPQVRFLPCSFDMGREAGLKEDRTQPGLMCLGLGCAAAAVDALNAKNWLSGFAHGLPERQTTVGHATFLQA